MIIKQEFGYTPTIDELAYEIWNLSYKEQCELLNKLGNIDSNYLICMQLQYMSDCNKIDKNGLRLVEQLYEYIKGNKK